MIDDFLAFNGTMLDVEAIDEIVRRRDRYRKQLSVTHALMVRTIDEMIGDLDRCAVYRSLFTPELEAKQNLLLNALAQAQGLDLPRSVVNDLDLEVSSYCSKVQSVVLEKSWRKLEKLYENIGIFFSSRTRKALDKYVKLTLAERGLAEALAKIEEIGVLVERTDLTSSVNDRVEHWLKTGQILGHRKKKVLEVVEVGQGIPKLNGTKPPRQEPMEQSKEFESHDVEVLQGIVFVPSGFILGRGFTNFSAPGADEGRNICLDRSNEVTPKLKITYNVVVVRRASDGNTYVRILGPTTVAQAA